jgi:hypothetical protein
MRVPTIKIVGNSGAYIMPAGHADNGYMLGCEPPRYPVPALADTATVLLLGRYNGQWCGTDNGLAWDEIWRYDIPDYC